MRPLTKSERARFEKIQRRSVGRPKVGQGAKVVAVTLEKCLMMRVDYYAKKHEMKRAGDDHRGTFAGHGRDVGFAIGSSSIRSPREISAKYRGH